MADYLENPKITLENDVWKLDVLPETGAKIISIYNKIFQRELIWKNPCPPELPPEYESSFELSDLSGFDECIPTISSDRFPCFPWKDTAVPDHGEVWSVPWSIVKGDKWLDARISGVRFPYNFSRSIRLSGDEIQLDYQVENNCAFSIPFLWSAHPLFAVEQDTSILIPPHREARIEWASEKENILTNMSDINWPEISLSDNRKISLDKVPPKDANFAAKIFFLGIPEGICGLRFPSDKTELKIIFSPDDIPYIGLWINAGGFPAGNNEHYNIALEPCTSPFDSLSKSYEQGYAKQAPPQSTVRWHIRIALSKTI